MGENLDAVDLELKATAIASGFDHCCALLQDGSIKCWGDSLWGELGQGSDQSVAAENVRSIPAVDLGEGMKANLD